MQFLVWIMAVLLLALWSATVWLSHAALQLIVGMPWNEAWAAVQKIELPALLKPFIEPWLGDAWIGMLQALAPLLQWLGSLLQGSSGLITGSLPVIAWLIWAVGALALLALAALGSGALWWMRKQKAQKLHKPNLMAT
jgi:hypothetical protein